MENKKYINKSDTSVSNYRGNKVAYPLRLSGERNREKLQHTFDNINIFNNKQADIKLNK